MKNHKFTGSEFVYADPPYLISSRKSKTLYKFEYSRQKHQELLTLLRNLPCKVMISGYWSELYADNLNDWFCHSYTSRDRNGQQRTEHLWMNYPTPKQQLHDYQYLGEDFRERERIKRKHLRLKEKILNFHCHEKTSCSAN